MRGRFCDGTREGEEPFERGGCRIKIILKFISMQACCNFWTNVVQNRKRWWILVNSAVQVRFI
jgi:hypothetical protein